MASSRGNLLQRISLNEEKSEQLLTPIRVIDHSTKDSSANITSAQESDVEDETKEGVTDSRWFEIFTGIAISTIPMVLGGYLLHVLTTKKE